MGKKQTYYGKSMSMSTNFPGSAHLMGFVEFSWEPISQTFPIQWGFSAFSNAMGNWWENPCISHMINYSTGWESNGKMHPFYGKSSHLLF